MTHRVERMLPLYEGKMGWQYDHRAASFVGTGDTDTQPNYDKSIESRVLPRYWVREEVVYDRLDRRRWGTDSALMGFRRVARNTDERTVIGTMLPFGAASYGWILSAGPDAAQLALLLAQYNSYAFDYLLRQFLSQPSVPQGTFSQLPILPPDALKESALGDMESWVVQRVRELAATGEELAGLANELGAIGLPVPWNPDVRERARLELDALMFLMFGVGRQDVDYIMETFPIVKRKDIAAHGSFRTKEMILEVFDAMQAALDSGEPYVSPLEADGVLASGAE